MTLTEAGEKSVKKQVVGHDKLVVLIAGDRTNDLPTTPIPFFTCELLRQPPLQSNPFSILVKALVRLANMFATHPVPSLAYPPAPVPPSREEKRK